MKLHEKFASYVKKWNDANVTEEQAKESTKWLMGDVEDMKPCKTIRKDDNNLEKAPYYPYNRYSVEYQEVPKPMETD